jgi:hypothetical protein
MCRLNDGKYYKLIMVETRHCLVFAWSLWGVVLTKKCEKNYTTMRQGSALSLRGRCKM